MRFSFFLLATPFLILAACDSPRTGPAPDASPSGEEAPAPPPSATPSAAPSASASAQPPADHVPPAEDAPPLPAAPTIYAPDMAERLRANKGLTLQWIDWNRRGTATVTVRENGEWHLTGSQRARDGKGRLTLTDKLTF